MGDNFEHFFTNNYPKVKSFAFRLLGSEEDAEDVAQEIFLKLLSLPDIWQNNELNSKFMFTMTKNRVFNLIKSRAIERKYYDSLKVTDNIIEEFGLEHEIYKKELELLAVHTIEQMPEQRKKIFKMSRFEHKSNLEIAASLGLSNRTVERHIYLALSELKKILLFFLFMIE